MIRHIVMFKLTAFATPSGKQAKMQEIKTRLEALKDKITQLHKIEVNFNVNPSEPWDIILTTEVQSLKELDAYASHPAHLEVATNVIAPVKAERACIDYEF
ncbi:MAG: Dabb family protein [Tannerellaceae bacterium]|jgi:hypothetical protein|nr:Dabb family protein [Tannerellaceae bacterium]